MVEKKKVPHLDLTVSLRRQPGAAQLIKKTVKSGRPVNVLAIVKQYQEYFDGGLMVTLDQFTEEFV